MDATDKASEAVDGEPIKPVSIVPNKLWGCSHELELVDTCALPADITHKTPLSVAFFMATSCGSSGSLKPASDPKLMLITSAPNLTESSIAAIISSSYAPFISGLLENTFIARSCASGATPLTPINPSTSSEDPLAPTIPATCIPCSPAAPTSIMSLFPSA